MENSLPVPTIFTPSNAAKATVKKVGPHHNPKGDFPRGSPTRGDYSDTLR